jgi:hypothetical protein
MVCPFQDHHIPKFFHIFPPSTPIAACSHSSHIPDFHPLYSPFHKCLVLSLLYTHHSHPSSLCFVFCLWPLPLHSTTTRIGSLFPSPNLYLSYTIHHLFPEGYSSQITLKMEAASTSKMPETIHRSTLVYIPYSNIPDSLLIYIYIYIYTYIHIQTFKSSVRCQVQQEEYSEGRQQAPLKYWYLHINLQGPVSQRTASSTTLNLKNTSRKFVTRRAMYT